MPVDSLELVQKYVGGEKSKPKIDKLGAGYWRNTKSRVKKYVEDIAKELIEFYAERELAKGHAFPPDDELFREMEERFEYEETEGQQRVIREVLDDLMRERPMDRIVCGDVGFGKTEVAIRSAFKAMIDNKQVALLVPDDRPRAAALQDLFGAVPGLPGQRRDALQVQVEGGAGPASSSA